MEGVTYTGGEPMAQAKALALLSERLRVHQLTIACYTGYTKELKEGSDYWIEKLLSNGPYIREQAGNLLWRGSSNQRVHFLTERYRHLDSIIDDSPAKVESIVSRKGFTTTGVWPEGFLERLREALK
ncbi:MAG: radical SAM protein [Armatimonadetes bacterium]|nr:radical SAM protein [Armatimonadota bacterium]